MRLIERVDFSEARFSETADGKRVVSNVAMLGPESQHGYTYEQEGMAKAVRAGLYEGCRIFINHKEAQTGRDVMELAGVFRQTRHEGGKVKGDAHLLPDEYGIKFFNIAKHMPEAASCSQVADGRLVRKNGKQYVEEITKVYSVDLVVAGATTKSVFESSTERNHAMNIREQREAQRDNADWILGADPNDVRVECGTIIDDETTARQEQERQLSPVNVVQIEESLTFDQPSLSDREVDQWFEEYLDRKDPMRHLSERQQAELTSILRVE